MYSRLIGGNVGAMRLFCSTRNYQITTDFNGQNGVLARVIGGVLFLK
jgi:hypothetical protein